MRLGKELIKFAFKKKYLMFTNMGISFTLASTGDIIQQRYRIMIGEKNSWRKERTLKMGISGLTIGFMTHHWYQYLETYFPGTTLKIVVKKVLLDQFVFAPAYITVFFIITGLWEKRPFEEILRELVEKGPILYMADWMVWPPAQFINFFYIPHKFRILYDNTFSICYDIYVSYLKHERKSSSEEEGE